MDEAQGEDRRVASRALGAVVGAAAAIGGSAVVLAVGGAGAPVQVVTGWAPDGADLGLGEVVVTVLVAVALAFLALLVFDRVASRPLRSWSTLVAVVGVLSTIPLWRPAFDVDTGSKVALTFMHAVTTVAVVVGQRVVARRAEARSSVRLPIPASAGVGGGAEG